METIPTHRGGNELETKLVKIAQVAKTEQGTPQGGIISPVLANVYLHYVLDLWFEKVLKRQYTGNAYIIRYADDFVCCFQHEVEARNLGSRDEG